jgi:hypothetical protein
MLHSGKRKILIWQSKRVEGQIQGTQDKSEKVKSEVRHMNLEQITKLSDDRERLYKYKRRHNNHKQERLREAERIWCTTKMIPFVNKSSLYLDSCATRPLETLKPNTPLIRATFAVGIPMSDFVPGEI